MNTPICDFVKAYAESGALRLHMPGHKGVPLLGSEPLDITEIDGADSLFAPDGIIRQSEENASSLFGAHTFYSTEGSSLCIRAMLYLTALYAKEQGKRFRIAAGRNAHKAFLSAAALTDADILWLVPKESDSYLSCPLSAEDLEKVLSEEDEKPAAVYLTSPDYLGHTSDIASLAEVCRRHGVLLLVDNAHGAYLKFLSPSRHPLDLGADLCCDSAHKTLPALTGSAYLHISPSAPPLFAEQAKNALSLFGTTSPSYLILQSLDRCNAYLADGYAGKLARFLSEAGQAKDTLRKHGYILRGAEPLKVTVDAKPYGYRGTELASLLAEKGIVSEFADPDFLVLMLTPEIGRDGLARMTNALLSIPPKAPITVGPPAFHLPKQGMNLRKALFSPSEQVKASDSLGRMLAVVTVGCPPAVPIVVSGEVIDQDAVKVFAYYGIETCTVVKE
ncbi:MAG: amino acid decarboxylase [Ruminococcaceae bacterium]|nr:amino acid decarboxylase [Oscillospiraceae bacterium]